MSVKGVLTRLSELFFKGCNAGKTICFFLKLIFFQNWAEAEKLIRVQKKMIKLKRIKLYPDMLKISYQFAKIPI